MGLFSGLFGGKQKQTQSASSAPWEAVQPYLKDLFSSGQQAKNSMSSAVMPEQLSAGLNEQQKLAQTQSLAAGGEIASQLPANLTALNTGLNATDINNNPALQGAMQAAINPVMRNFERRVLPQITMNALTGSGIGSSRQGIAEGIATSDLNQQLLDTTATMGNAAYNKGQDTMLSSLQLAPSVFQSMMLPSATTAAVGNQNQAMEQQFLNDALTKWNFDRSKTMDALQQYAQLLSGNFGGTSTSTSTTKGGNGLGQLIGAATALAGAV